MKMEPSRKQRAISLFPTVFSKNIYCRHVKTRGKDIFPAGCIIGIVTGLLRYPYPEDWIFNRVISNIFVLLRETTLTVFRFHLDSFSCRIRNSESGFPKYNGKNRDKTIRKKKKLSSGADTLRNILSWEREKMKAT